jgi:hypothetical protein
MAAPTKSARQRFFAALGLYVAWVAALAILASLSASRPATAVLRTRASSTAPVAVQGSSHLSR